MHRRLALAALAALVLATPAAAHRERPTTYPDPATGAVPAVRTGGPSLVVCKPDSRKRGAAPALVARCRYHDIQSAVDAASNGTRILVLPGVYREEPSRAKPLADPACASMMVPASDQVPVASYDYQLHCPNAQNLIAIVGDSDGDGVCDDKCGIQILGMGAKPSDVLIVGDRRKLNVIRADRADGVVLRNFTIEYSDFNNIYVIETNGFRLEKIVSRWSREYGFLSFTSDHGLYNQVVAYGSGDSGIYTGAGPEGHCARYGIEVRNSESYGNSNGFSGTSGNGIWIHDSSFHDNGIGMSVDSAFGGHPGMPQDCSKWERNRIYSNNYDVFSAKRDAYCKQAPPDRDPKIPCPVVVEPVGTGLVIAGGNGNIVRDNWIYDNHRAGVRLFYIPAFARGEQDPAKAHDTSHDNRFTANHMGTAPGGKAMPNGVDFWWDEEGSGNCWQGNRGARGGPVTSDPPKLDTCPGSADLRPVNQKKFDELVACSAWNPLTNTDPKGCPWTRG